MDGHEILVSSTRHIRSIIQHEENISIDIINRIKSE